jgi:type IV secretory pathway VirB4 component
MAHLSSVYPFHVDAPVGAEPGRGPVMGYNVTAGMGAFHFDPFELYDDVLTNPNVTLQADLGMGKSAWVKTFIMREWVIYGNRRFFVVVDPKGEYAKVAKALGMTVVRLYPGGRDVLNVMDPTAGRERTDVVDRQRLATSLVAGVLHRPLQPIEGAALSSAIERVARERDQFVLGHVREALQDPGEDLVQLLRMTPDEIVRASVAVITALNKLCTETLAGMFDGKTTVDIDWENGSGVVLDVSAVYGDDEAMPLVMAAATSWMAALLRRRGPRRIVLVIDEAWAVVRLIARDLQSWVKLAREYGWSIWLLVHNVGNLGSQSDDGSADAKIAAGLLSDIQTRVIGRLPPDQLAAAVDAYGLNEQQAQLVGGLVKGRALWIMKDRMAVVQNRLSPLDLQLCDTDSSMAA